MTMETIVNGDAAEIVLGGWLDTQSAAELEKALKALGPEVKKLDLNLKDLEYISSSGIRLLVTAHKTTGGALTIKNVSGGVLEALEMTGISKRLNIV